MVQSFSPFLFIYGDNGHDQDRNYGAAGSILQIKIAKQCIEKTKDERKDNLRGCYPLSVPDNKMRKYIELENVEDVELGLRPRPMRKE